MLNKEDLLELERYERSLKRKEAIVNILTTPLEFVKWLRDKIFAENKKYNQE